MLRRQRAAVHLVGQHHVVPHRVLDAKAARVVLLDAALDAAVMAGEDDLDGVTT